MLILYLQSLNIYIDLTHKYHYDKINFNLILLPGIILNYQQRTLLLYTSIRRWLKLLLRDKKKHSLRAHCTSLNNSNDANFIHASPFLHNSTTQTRVKVTCFIIDHIALQSLFSGYSFTVGESVRCPNTVGKSSVEITQKRDDDSPIDE